MCKLPPYASQAVSLAHDPGLERLTFGYRSIRPAPFPGFRVNASSASGRSKPLVEKGSTPGLQNFWVCNLTLPQDECLTASRFRALAMLIVPFDVSAQLRN